MANANDIRFDQRNSSNTAYQEKYVSGSNLILRTDSLGTVTGSNTLEGIAIGTISRSLANFTTVSASNLYANNFTVQYLATENIVLNTITASYGLFNFDLLISGLLKVFGKIYAYDGIIGDVTGSVSGSNAIFNTITSSNIVSNNNNLTNITSSNISSSNNILINITSSNISASNYVSASNIYVENTIVSDTGSFVYFNLNNTGSSPLNYNDPGLPGEVRFDNNFIYIYTNNVWVRTPIVRWTS